MSLINEALKKAQRARVEDQAGTDAPPVPGGTPIVKRRQARSANTMVLLGAGALALVIVSVVATVYFVSRSSTPKTEVAVAQPAASPASGAAAATAPATSVVTPGSVTPAATTPPAPAVATAPTSTPASTTAPASTPPAQWVTMGPAPAATSTTAPAIPATPPVTTAASATPSPLPPASTSPAVMTNPTPAVITPSPAVAATPTPTPGPPGASDPRVATFVDAIRVTGIRSSGNESRVLMNDRVYRVNDIVERNLSVRLVKVGADSLTFSDANGVSYVKYF